MAPITDLSWRQLNDALKNRLGITQDVITHDAQGKPATLNIAAIVKAFPVVVGEEGDEGVEYGGVIKFMAILHDSCRDTQATANTGQVAAERLTAFPDPTSGAPLGTLVPVTRTMIARADLASVTRVIGKVG